MFIIKVLGSFIIIITCSLLGFLYGGRYSERLNNLMGLQNCIQLLETEVMYSANPLPEALENVYKKGNKRTSFVFKNIKDNLDYSKNLSMVESFYSIKGDLKDKLKLEDEDIEVFFSLGSVLGSSSREDQQKHFKGILTQLKSQQKEAERKKDSNEKMYKSLGILGGFLIVFILI